MTTPTEANATRAVWANEALKTFQGITSADDEDAVGDLICNLMHLCALSPKQFGSFDLQLSRAIGHYDAEKQCQGCQEHSEDCTCEDAVDCNPCPACGQEVLAEAGVLCPGCQEKEMGRGKA